MALADPRRDAHRRHAGIQAPAPAPRSAAYSAHHARAARADSRLADAPYLFGSLGASCSTNCMRWSHRSAAICSRSGWRGCSRSRPNSPASDCPRRWRSPTICAASSCRSPTGGTRWPISSSPRAAPHPTSPCSTPPSICPGPAIRRTTRSAKSTICIKRHKTTLVFVNTRSQAESIFQELWRINDDALAIALHHGSLDVAQRRKVEAAMAEGSLRAVVCTSSLDLGVDWGDVDLVINVGAPKGASRLLQRIGRANHRMDEPSRGVLVPANRFEVLECTRRARRRCGECAGHAGRRASARSTCWRSTCSAAPAASRSSPTSCSPKCRSAAPYAGLTRAEFDAVRRFRRHRRLRAQGLRALRQDPAGPGRPLARQPSADRAALPHEYRHHRRGRHAQGAAGALARLED